MSQTSSPASPELKYLAPAQPLTKINHYDYAETAYTVFAFVISLILIGLGLRLMFALFVVDNAFARGITIYTQPFVAPFAHRFKDINVMLQTSTASAFTGYYLFYWIIALASRFVRSPQASAETKNQSY